MRHRCYVTPGWRWRLPLLLSLLIGAALLEGKVLSFVTWSMIIAGLFLLVHGWTSTIMNIRRVNKEVEKVEKDRIKKMDEETEGYFRRMKHA